MKQISLVIFDSDYNCIKILKQLDLLEDVNIANVYIISKDNKDIIQNKLENTLKEQFSYKPYNIYIYQFDIDKDLYELYKVLKGLINETLNNFTHYLLIHYLLYPEHLPKFLKLLKLISLEYIYTDITKDTERVKVLIESPLINTPENFMDYPLFEMYYIDYYSGKDILWDLLKNDVKIPFALIPENKFNELKDKFNKDNIIEMPHTFSWYYTMDGFFELIDDDIENLNSSNEFLSKYGCYYDMVHSHVFTTIALISLMFREIINSNSMKFKERLSLTFNNNVKSNIYNLPFSWINPNIQLFKHKDVYDKFEKETAIFIFNQASMHEFNIFSGKGLEQKKSWLAFKLNIDNELFQKYKKELKDNRLNIYFYLEFYPNPQVKIIEEDIFGKDNIKRKVIYEDTKELKQNEYVNIYRNIINNNELFKDLFCFMNNKHYNPDGFLYNLINNAPFINQINSLVEKERTQNIFFEYSNYEDIEYFFNNLVNINPKKVETLILDIIFQPI